MVAYLNAELAKFMSHKSHRQEIIHLKATLYKKKKHCTKSFMILKYLCYSNPTSLQQKATGNYHKL